MTTWVIEDTNATKRETRKWWAVANDRVQLVDGYSCGPNNPDVWWCPKVGYSLSEHYHLFSTELEALDTLCSELRERIEVDSKTLEVLISRRQHLAT